MSLSIPKVCGIETEYGITMPKTADANPITASSMLINAFVNEISGKVGWDFEDEAPGHDARGFNLEGSLPHEVETHLVNTVLTNGARFYVDHAHPEYSSPECLNPKEAVLYDKAGELVLRKAMSAAKRALPNDQEIVVYKNNSDRKGNSYGCHENYIMDRQVPFNKIVKQVTPFFVTRQIYCGSGKVGSEFANIAKWEVPFQISQRADFFEEVVGLETTLKRPIVNTRDEPHADATRYRRLHVILGDANMSQFSSYLKLGTTALVLSMIEDSFLDEADLAIEDPVGSLRKVSWDLSLSAQLSRVSGGSISALDLQWEFLRLAQKYAIQRGTEVIGGDDLGEEILLNWEETLQALEVDPMSLADRLDWVAKYQLVLGYMERHSLDWDDPKLAAIDLQYHDIRPEKSLFHRLGIRSIWSDAEAELATYSPPRGTRAYFRGKCLEKYPRNVAAANWDSIIFDLGRDPLRRVPMMDPLRGTAKHVDELIDRCDTAQELLDALGT